MNSVRTMDCDQDNPRRSGQRVTLDVPDLAGAEQPHAGPRNAPVRLAGAAGRGGRNMTDPLMARLMARLEAQAIPQAGHHFDLEAGKRRFMTWLARSGETSGNHEAPLGPERPADRLDIGQLGYSPLVTRRLLGTLLRRFREFSGTTVADAGYHIRASATKISRMELGKVSFKSRDVVDLLDLYGVTDPHKKDALLYLVRQSNEPAWWRDYADILPDWFEAYLALEEAAHLIRTYEAAHVPELLQTEDYAKALAVLTSPGAEEWEIDKRLQILKERQAALNRSGAPRLWAVIDEAALRRQVGGPEVMHGQVRYLAEASALPGVTIQILPLSSGAGAVTGGSFAILRFMDPDLPDVVYIESLTSAVYLDSNADVEHYLQVMEALTASAAPPSRSAQALREIFPEWYQGAPSRRQHWPPR